MVELSITNNRTFDHWFSHINPSSETSIKNPSLNPYWYVQFFVVLCFIYVIYVCLSLVINLHVVVVVYHCSTHKKTWQKYKILSIMSKSCIFATLLYQQKSKILFFANLNVFFFSVSFVFLMYEIKNYDTQTKHHHGSHIPPPKQNTLL